MIVLVKIIVLFFSFALSLSHLNNQNVICAVISIILFLYFLNNLTNQYKNYINDNWRYTKPSRYNFNNINSSYNWDYSINDIPSRWNDSDKGVTTKSVIKNLSKTIVNNKHNFIEFCDKPRFLIEQSDYYDKRNNDNGDLMKFTDYDSNQEDLVNNSVIMVINDAKINDTRKIIYESILSVFNKYSFKPNEKYALLESFYYIDICPMSIIIYVDKFIIAKAHLNETDLHKDEIIDNIKDALYCPNIDINFIDLNCVNLLNYYLKK